MHLKHHVIFIEGLPGSGKTTFARKLANHYQSLGLDVVQYNEGDLHPIDLSWCAYCDRSQYQQILNEYPHLVDEIKTHTSIEGDRYIIAYTRMKHSSIDQGFFDKMEQYEIYRSPSREAFLNAHKKRWSLFNQTFDPNKLYIFECVFIQNHINELILNDDAKLDEIMRYFKDLISTIQDTQPIVYYIEQMNVKKTLKKIIEERRTDDPTKYRDWIDNVTRYMKSTNYGEKLGYLGEEGFVRYGTYRQKMAKTLLEALEIDHRIFPLKDDYDVVFDAMKKTRL